MNFQDQLESKLKVTSSAIKTKVYFVTLSTDDYEIQDVEGVKRIAPPLTAQTNDSTGLLLIASDSL